MTTIGFLKLLCFIMCRGAVAVEQVPVVAVEVATAVAATDREA
jgi:hypothetical protein